MYNIWKLFRPCNPLIPPQRGLNLQHIQKLSSNILPKDPRFKISQMTLEQLKKVIPWANDAGWFFCKGDAEIYFKSDARGLFVGEIDGEPICSYGVFTYGEYSFLTLHIVKEEYQGKGYGILIERCAIDYTKDSKTICLDAADHFIPRYKNLGYKQLCEIKTFTRKAMGIMGPNLVNLKEIPIDQLAEFDERNFGYPRKHYLQATLEQETNYGLGVIKDGQLKGFGIIKKLEGGTGYSLSPLTAEDKETAKEIFSGLQSYIVGEDITTEICVDNSDAIKIMEEQGWEQMTSYIRIYDGEKPKTKLTTLYSMCSY